MVVEGESDHLGVGVHRENLGGRRGGARGEGGGGRGEGEGRGTYPRVLIVTN